MDPETLAALILLEDEDADILWLFSTREETHKMYKFRNQEGYYRILIENHLDVDDEKFRGFFRLNKDHFDFVLNLVYVEYM